MSEMEPDIRTYLVKILQTISMGLVWMLANMTIGIYFSFAFFDDRPSIWNYCYYAFFLASLAWLLRYYKKKWKGFI